MLEEPPLALVGLVVFSFYLSQAQRQVFPGCVILSPIQRENSGCPTGTGSAGPIIPVFTVAREVFGTLRFEIAAS